MRVSLLAGGILFSAATGFTVATGAQSLASGSASTGTAALTAASYPATSLQCQHMSLPFVNPAQPTPVTVKTPPATSTTSPTSTPPTSPTETPTSPTETPTSPTETPTSPTTTPTTDTPTTTPPSSDAPNPSTGAGDGTTDPASPTPVADPTPTPAPSDSGESPDPAGSDTAATETAALAAFRAPAQAAATKLSTICVGVERATTSIKHGQNAEWVISVYTTGNNTTNASVALSAAPAGLKPKFDFGCGTQDGTAACKLGNLDAGASIRQVQAQITVPATSTATAVRLTATVSADHVPVKPQASVTVTVVPGVGAPQAHPTNFLTQPAFQNPAYLPLVSPSVVGAGTSLSPGGNAAGLFPTVGPDGTGSGPLSGSRASGGLSPISLAADDMSTISAQIAGLAALLLAIVIAGIPRVRARAARLLAQLLTILHLSPRTAR